MRNLIRFAALTLAIGCAGGEGYDEAEELGQLEQEIVVRQQYGWLDATSGPLPCPSQMVSGTCYYPDPARSRRVSAHINLSSFGVPGTLERELVQWGMDDAVARFNAFFTAPTGWVATWDQTAFPDVTISNDGAPDDDFLTFKNGVYGSVEDYADTRCATVGATLTESPSIAGIHKVCKVTAVKFRPDTIWLASIEGAVPGQQNPSRKRDIYEWLCFQGLLRAAGVGVGLNDAGTVYNTDRLLPLNKSGIGVGPTCWLDSVGFINPTLIQRDTRTCI